MPADATVFTAASVSTEQIGLAAALEAAAGPGSVRRAFTELDPERAGDRARMRALACAPDWAVGSVHAVTAAGEILVASSSGSQLASYAYGAGRVLWVVGRQKVVPDLDAAYRRVREHCLPREDARARGEYGVGSAINKLLVLHGEPDPDRVHVLLVDQPLGY